MGSVGDLGRGRGPYYVPYEDSGEPQKVSRSEYVRHKYGDIAIGVLISGGVLLAVVAASRSRASERESHLQQIIDLQNRELSLTSEQRAKRDAERQASNERLDRALRD